MTPLPEPKFKQLNLNPIDSQMVCEYDSLDVPDRKMASFFKLPRKFEVRPIDYAICVEIAKARNWECIIKGVKDSGTATREREMDIHIVGALGEYAVARLLDKAWIPGVNTFKSRPDVGEEEVRARIKGEMEIFYTNGDKENKRYWLVTGQPPILTIQGWARLDDLKAVPEEPGEKKSHPCKDGVIKYYVHNKHLKLYIPVISKHWMSPRKPPVPTSTGQVEEIGPEFIK